MKPRVISILFAMSLFSWLPGQDENTRMKLPPEAQKLVEVFESDATKLRSDAENVIEKKSSVLATALQALQEKLTKKGDLDGALLIKAKVTELTKASPLKTSGSITQIPSSSTGVSLGKLASGRIIVLQYTDGTWGDGGALNGLSPDDINTPGGCKLKLIGPNIEEFVPPNTKDKAWEYKVKSGGEFFLKSGDGSPGDNPGVVTYRVEVR